eukprot:1949288-Alexandrium_andersonii.AAC.1
MRSPSHGILGCAHRLGVEAQEKADARNPAGRWPRDEDDPSAACPFLRAESGVMSVPRSSELTAGGAALRAAPT